ncbi:MAG: HNH endonuclease [Deltaproteobacteria bacterium]|nr:HNH endonuclease [Deltaproteobacteria bacterium]
MRRKASLPADEEMERRLRAAFPGLGRLAPIEGSAGYFVSDDGRVFSLRRDRPRERRPSHFAGSSSKIHLGGSAGLPTTLNVAKLVASAFIPQPPHGKPHLAHLDGDYSNNRVENLRWVSRAERVGERWRSKGLRQCLSELQTAFPSAVGLMCSETHPWHFVDADGFLYANRGSEPRMVDGEHYAPNLEEVESVRSSARAQASGPARGGAPELSAALLFSRARETHPNAQTFYFLSSRVDMLFDGFGNPYSIERGFLPIGHQMGWADVVRAEFPDAGDVRPVAGFDGYFVSSAGLVLSCLRRPPVALKARPLAAGPIVTMLRTGRQHVEYVAALVARAFLGDSEGRRIEHIDDDVENVRADNLRWAPVRRVKPTEPAAQQRSRERTSRTDEQRIRDAYPRVRDVRQVKGTLAFYVTSDGRVFSLRSSVPRLLKRGTDRGGRVMVQVDRSCSVALLVARAFLDQPPFAGLAVVEHLNGNRRDCRAENLRWAPRSKVTSAVADRRKKLLAATSFETLEAQVHARYPDAGWLKPVPDCPGTVVSDGGLLFSFRRGFAERLRSNRVLIAAGPRAGSFQSRALTVAGSFLPPPPSPFSRLEHLDGDPSNCARENLAWAR